MAGTEHETSAMKIRGDKEEPPKAVRMTIYAAILGKKKHSQKQN